MNVLRAAVPKTRQQNVQDLSDTMAKDLDSMKIESLGHIAPVVKLLETISRSDTDGDRIIRVAFVRHFLPWEVGNRLLEQGHLRHIERRETPVAAAAAASIAGIANQGPAPGPASISGYAPATSPAPVHDPALVGGSALVTGIAAAADHEPVGGPAATHDPTPVSESVPVPALASAAGHTAVDGVTSIGDPVETDHIYKRGAVQSHEGDWKCGKCGWLNDRWILYCQRDYGEKAPCESRRDDGTAGHVVQEPGNGVAPPRPSSARYRDEWLCRHCKIWSWAECRECHRHGTEDMLGEDGSLELGLHPYHDKKKYWSKDVAM